MPPTPQSPYASALGDRQAALHPALQQYFATIPDGHVGRGAGTFDVVGTRLRWLRVLLRPLQRRGVLYAGWAENVPFRVTNRTIGGHAVAERELDVPGGTWVMRDSVAAVTGGCVVDHLGSPPLVAARFDIAVTDGALRLTSTAVGVRLGPLRVRVPRGIRPVVTLEERFDDARQKQRVQVTIDAPILGRVYEYAGLFDYRIEKE